MYTILLSPLLSLSYSLSPLCARGAVVCIGECMYVYYLTLSLTLSVTPSFSPSLLLSLALLPSTSLSYSLLLYSLSLCNSLSVLPLWMSSFMSVWLDKTRFKKQKPTSDFSYFLSLSYSLPYSLSLLSLHLSLLYLSYSLCCSLSYPLFSLTLSL